MKKILAITVSMLLCGTLFSQKIDNRLLKSFDENTLIDLKKNDVQKYNLLISSIGNAIEIVELPLKKGKSKLLNEITLPDGEYNYLDLGLEIKEENQYFKITNTDKMMIVKSFYVLRNELKLENK